MLIPLILILVNIIAWYPVLNFWFLGGWEPAWLIGICGYNFNLICLMQSHGILSLFNYFVFGWNPWGWYLSAIVLHISSVLLIYLFISKLLKNSFFAFLTALLFGLNVAHNDVINWGSFEGLYALIMVSFMVSLLSYMYFRETTKITRYAFYGVSLFFYLFALFIREIAMALPFFVILTEFFIRDFKFTKKNLIASFLYSFPFVIVTIGYVIFRNWYGGAPHDFIDGMVQLRISLLGQGEYVEYIFRGILSFGRYASSHLVPYPIINDLRDVAARFFYAPYVTSYFFPVIGIGYFLLQLVILWFVRKERKLRNILIFALIWFLVPTIFFSFAFSITDYELERPLVWNYTRWRYYAFLGTVLYWLTLSVYFYRYLVDNHKKYTRHITIGAFLLLIAYLLLNFFYLRVIQKDIYNESFRPAKEFYQALTSTYKTLPKDYVFYYFPFAPSLNDRLAEFYYLRREYYPNLVEERRDWTEGHMGMVLDQLDKKDIDYKHIIFLDLDEKGKFYDRTQDVTKALRVLSSQSYSVNNYVTSSGITIPLNPLLHVEFPYIVEISATTSSGESSYEFDREKVQALKGYAEERQELLKNVKVSVCNTAPLGGRGAPAMHLLPKNMIDGNIGKRSFWAADCRPAWVVLDFGAPRAISGFLFRGEPNGPNIPSEYTLETSLDNTHWKKVFSRTHNTNYQKIETLPQIENARYIRFTAMRTTQGGMAMLDELEAFGPEGKSAISLYGDNVEKLFSESYQISPYLHLLFETNPNNFAPDELSMHNSLYLPLISDGQAHTYTFTPNEGEYFSAQGQFLKRFITSLQISPTVDSNIFISEVRIAPVYGPRYLKNSVQ